jgi:hypothetical protein
VKRCRDPRERRGISVINSSTRITNPAASSRVRCFLPGPDSFTRDASASIVPGPHSTSSRSSSTLSRA